MQEVEVILYVVLVCVGRWNRLGWYELEMIALEGFGLTVLVATF